MIAALSHRRPGTMLGLAARDNRRTQKLASKKYSPIRSRARTITRALLATVALTIGLVGLSTSSAQAFPWDDMKDNITATIQNICRPNDAPQPATYTNIDTMAGLNQAEPDDGYRSTIMPNFKEDQKGGQGGNGVERLQRVYGDNGDVIAKPTYERYGFSTLQWHSYGNECMSPTLVMSPLANMSLMSMVHVPMMISMAFLNFVMDETLYTAFATLMQPFIGAMYQIFEPWIYVLVPIGIFITWLASKHSLQATLKSGGWGLFIMSVYLLMGESTSQVVGWGTNVVTEVSGSAACKMAAANNGGQSDGAKCDADDPVKAVQQALWYGVPYQTWHLGQVGEHQAQLDEEALDKGEVGWGPALLNGQYVGVDEEGEIDETGKKVLRATGTWNSATYSPDGDESKNIKWGKDNLWDKVPYLANIKIMCDDRDNGDDTPGDDDNAMRRWMYNGASGSSQCDSAGAGTADMIPHIKGDQYNKQILIAMSGLVGVTAVSLTIVGSALYLGFQKMMFYFLLFLAPVVLLVSSLGDRKRRPFAVRYAEIVGVNLLKQVAAVCVVLFVSYSMASLFGSGTFAYIPWIMKPHAALLFFLALAFLAFPLKNMVKGAIQGDTSVLDKQATAPQRAMKTTAKVAAIGAAAVATGGAGLAAVGGISGIAPAVAAAGGKGVVMGKAGSMLGQAGRVMGIGSKTGRAMRAGGQLLSAGQGMMHARDNLKGRKLGMFNAAAKMLRDNPSKYRRFNYKTGQYDRATESAKQRAMKDAQGMAEQGAGYLRQGISRDKFLRQWDAAYEGADPDIPPQSGPIPVPKPAPKPLPKPGSPSLPPGGDKQREVEGRPASGGDPSSSDSQSPDNNPTPGGGSAFPSLSHNVSAEAGGSGTGHARAQVHTYEEYAEKARGNLSGPAFSREMDYNVNTVRSGEDVLHNAGLTKQQVVADPTVLLSGSAYDGGRTTAMDPFHPATSGLNELRFAGSSGNESDIESAVAKAVTAIDRHGVPGQVGGVHAIGDRASRFDPLDLVGAMPELRESMSWQERAEVAHTMQAAQIGLPADVNDTIRDGIADFTDYLSRPSSDIQDLITLRDDVIADIDWGMRTNGRVWDVADTSRGTIGETQTPFSRDQPAPPPEPAETSPVEAEDEMDDDDALIFRPKRRRKRLERFDHYDSAEDEEDHQ